MSGSRRSSRPPLPQRWRRAAGGLTGQPCLGCRRPFSSAPWFSAGVHLGGVTGYQLPQWLLALSYAMIGWSIGLNFTRPILLHAARALPQILLRSLR